MCGFLGVFAAASKPLELPDWEKLRSSAQKLAHRGNSSQGELLSSAHAFFHHRLAFRDLQEGKQPLTDSLNRATIIFNGELYGFQNLRASLQKKYDFRTRSDTEVILAAYLCYGEELLQYFDGEFAFVIRDHRSGRILAARDTFGVKPLFFGGDFFGANFQEWSEEYGFTASGRLHLASEIKGLGFPLRWSTRGLNRSFLSLYEEMGTTFENVFAMPPGSILTAEPNETGWNCRIIRKNFKKRNLEKSSESFESRAKELEEILSLTVKLKLEADVPLGAYLSGGIDSRIAAYEMQKTGTPIETFTVGFEGEDFDETQQVGKFLEAYPNLRGRALRTNNEALEYAYAHSIYASELVQPYTNGSAKWWLSRFARRYVRGVLTGDGADELFCGYPSYRQMAWWDFYRRHRSPARAALFEKRVLGPREKYWEKGLSAYGDSRELEESKKILGWYHPLFSQVKFLSEMWLEDSGNAFLNQEKSSLASFTFNESGKTPLSSLTSWQNYFMHTHFPTHVLNWVGDRMEMANTLEGRPVFLSAQILKFYRESPDHHLVRGMRDKAVLRKAYEGKLGTFASAPKKQFNAPFLFEGALAQEFLSEAALKKTGLIDPKQIKYAKEKRSNTKDPLEKNFLEIFLQNCLVTQMLDRYLVAGQPPIRDLALEEAFLDKNTVNL